MFYILRFPNYFFLIGGVENLKARLARTYIRVPGNTHRVHERIITSFRASHVESLAKAPDAADKQAQLVENVVNAQLNDVRPFFAR